MFFPEGQIRVHLYGQPCDMRKSFEGLQALVRHELRADPCDGSLYCFISRRATQMRVLYFDRSGFCVWAKRLEAGRFIGDWSQVRTRQMDWTGLKLLLEGIEPGRQRKRYSLPATLQNSPPNTSPNIDARLYRSLRKSRDTPEAIRTTTNRRRPRRSCLSAGRTRGSSLETSESIATRSVPRQQDALWFL